MNAPLKWSDIADAGAFTTDQVGALTGATPAVVASWLRGVHPLICPDYELIGGRLALSFAALLEARVVAYLLGNGMTRRKVRELVRALRHRLGDRHPLARDRVIVTDGARAFDATDDKLINLLNDCYASPDLMKPALHGRVAYSPDRALYLIPAPKEFPLVRIDPHRAFGRPIIVEQRAAVPTATLAHSAEIEGESETASWFNVSAGAVKQAVGFEKLFSA